MGPAAVSRPPKPPPKVQKRSSVQTIPSARSGSSSTSKSVKSGKSKNPIADEEPDSSDLDEESGEEEEDLCVICDDNKRTHMCYPCGHKSLCASCVKSCRKDLKECPLCRKRIKDIVKVFE